MGAGIVCKVWNIKGNTDKKNASAQLKDSIGYILNEEKTDAKINIENAIFKDENGQLERECKYVENDIKTVNGAYVGTRNLISDDVKAAVNEMMNVKKFYGKTGGRTALHGIISLQELESEITNAEDLMKLCNDVLEELFPNHQAIFAVHTNTEDLHVHFIVNSVGLDGKKIHQPDGFVKNVLHPCVNKYAEKYGFTPNDKWKKYNTNGVTEIAKIKMDLRKMVDKAIENANSFDDFLTELRTAGATVNVGKHISIQIEGMNKAMRSHHLGNSYTRDSIISRIQSRRLAFDKLDIGSHVLNKREDDVLNVKFSVLKKYKDMNTNEKKEVVRMLRLGMNPWKIHARNNWQLRNMVDEINLSVRLNEYISFYSLDGTVQGALDGIINAKKQISEEKKLLKTVYKKYKPILDIYEEMKGLEKRSYLYEHEKISEYRAEYEKYRELTRRLKNGYGKNVLEVANFMEEYSERLMYANAQLEELSSEYREIKNYCREKGIEKIKMESLYDMVIDPKMEKLAVHNVFSTDVSYLVSATSPDIMLRVVHKPVIDNKGNTVENTVVTVLNKYGEVLSSLESKDGKKQLRDYLYRLEHEYGFKNCEQFKDALKAKEYMEKCQKEIDGSGKNENNHLVPTWHEVSKIENTYSFTQAINLKSVASNVGIYVIANTNSSPYMAVISSNENSISIKVVDRNGIEQETAIIPGIYDRTNDGYKTILRLAREYGFSDSMMAFSNIEEARRYINTTDKKTYSK